jgi:peptide/nickel transport system ATP-binding protein
MSQLEVEDLEVYYETEDGPAQAVDGVSFELEQGENLGIVGESGCGKTTLAKAIIGILPDAGYINNGRIGFKGDDLTELPDPQRRRLKWEEISMIAQSAMNSLDPVYTICE